MKHMEYLFHFRSLVSSFLSGILMLVLALTHDFVYAEVVTNPVVATDCKMLKAEQKFSFELTQDVLRHELSRQLQTQKRENLLISPLSANIALGMLYQGAELDTSLAMQRTLSFDSLDRAFILEGYKNLMQSLKSGGGKDGAPTLRIANAIWTNESFPVKKSYQETLASYFGAEAKSLNFRDLMATTIVNGWVSEQTERKISTIVGPDDLSGAELVLTNALYLKADWQYPFEKNRTMRQKFLLQDGSSSSIVTPMMNIDHYLPYAEVADYQVVALPYANSSLMFYAFLANDREKNLSQQVSEVFSESFFADLDKSLTTDPGDSVNLHLTMPKLDFSSTKILNENLRALGMGIAFTDSAEFGGISAVPTKVSKVVQKTYLKVDELGTEAAAVTAVIMVRSTSVMNDFNTKSMILNRPFLMAIRDQNTGAFLFTGVIQMPSINVATL